MGTTPVNAKSSTGDEIPRDDPLMAYTERLLEQKELQLRKYIEENYSKIRDVERELANLTLELKLTAGPKKAALEHMRKKIELSTENIKAAKLKEEQAKKAWEAAEKALKDEEAYKKMLCEDLNRLVQESASLQYSRLEELKRRLEALTPGEKEVSNSTEVKATGSSPVSSDLSTCNRSDLDNTQSKVSNPDGPTNQLSSMPNSHAVSAPHSSEGKTHSVESKNEKGSVEKSNSSSKAPSAKQMAEGLPTNIKRGQGHHPNRAKGNLILPKPKGEIGGSWTGAGFD